MTTNQLLSKLRAQLDSECAKASNSPTRFEETKIRALIGRIEGIERDIVTSKQ